jgi:hypothetical protein
MQNGEAVKKNHAAADEKRICHWKVALSEGKGGTVWKS